MDENYIEELFSDLNPENYLEELLEDIHKESTSDIENKFKDKKDQQR